MSTLSTAVLFVAEAATSFLDGALDMAADFGLPVTSWRAGDSTRTLYTHNAEMLAELDQTAAEYAKSGFLSEAEGDWKEINAREVYGVDKEEASYATSTLVLTNAGGGVFEFPDAGDLIVKSSTSDKTYHSTTTGTLTSGPGSTLTIEVEADEAGSDSSAAVDEIDEIVSPTLPDVSITSSTAASARDAQTDEELETACNASLGALSPNGPPDAYEYVCTRSALTGVTDITRAKSSSDSPTGVVTVYVAGPSGPVLSGSVTAAQAAVDQWATPLCITPTVVNATAQAINVTATVSGASIPAGLESSVSAALATLFQSVSIGGWVTLADISKTIKSFLATEDRVTISAPAADTDLADGVVPTVGTVSISEA